VLLVLAFVFIKRGKKKAHGWTMVMALLVSALFLCSYLGFRIFLVQTTGQGHIPFREQGTIRTVYFVVLITHLVGVFIITPLVPVTVYFSAKKRWERHKKLARWAWPIWMYVSVTGLLVYFIFNVWYPSADLLEQRARAKAALVGKP
jgi:putative membrane protein